MNPKEAFYKVMSAAAVVAALAGCSGEKGTSSVINATPIPTATPGTAWAKNCTANAEVEPNDNFGDVVARAQKQCSGLSINDGYESMRIQGRSVNEIYAGETITLFDYTNVP